MFCETLLLVICETPFNETMIKSEVFIWKLGWSNRPGKHGKIQPNAIGSCSWTIGYDLGFDN